MILALDHGYSTPCFHASSQSSRGRATNFGTIDLVEGRDRIIRTTRSNTPRRDNASHLGCATGPAQGPHFYLRPPRHLHRGAVAVRPLPDARGLGAVAAPFPDRDQPAAVRGPRPREHERDVRQRAAGGAGPAQTRPTARGAREPRACTTPCR